MAFPSEWDSLTAPDHFWFQWRLRAALAQVRAAGIPGDRPLRVLEIGSGTGVLRDQIEGATSWVVDMADLRLAALESARPGRGRRLYYDVSDLHPDLVDSYDVVVLFDVLEHVAQTGPFVASVVRHLKPGGHLLVNVPAIQGLYSDYDRAAGHVRRYDRRRLEAEFDGTGLVVRATCYWGLSLVPLLLARKLLVQPSRVASVIRAGFVPPGPLAHKALQALMGIETRLFRRPFVGSSLLLVGARPSATV
jgi:SAM-dependent methyltransferase